jgi:hypothetical protein
MHRVENLNRRERVEQLVAVVERIAAERPVRFVLHGPTRHPAPRGLDAGSTAAGVELVPLAPHGEFVAMLHAAPFVITDGGSIQEECALLGHPDPAVAGRDRAPDGVGANVVVSGYDHVTGDPDRSRQGSVVGGWVFGEGFASVLAAARRGDETAWTRLYLDLAPTLTGYLRGRGCPTPEDVTSETCCRSSVTCVPVRR